MHPPPTTPPATERTAAYRQRLAERRYDLSRDLAQIVPSAAGSLVWEVGCGHGHFLTAYAQTHPGTPCVGIDIASDRIARARRKRDRSRLTHLHFIHADARLFLEVLPEGVTFSQVFILFPDPWPKLRHHKHRILQPDFLTAVARHSSAHTRLHFRTDYQPYFEAARATIDQHGRWMLSEEPWPFEFKTVFQERADQHQSLTARLRPAPDSP